LLIGQPKKGFRAGSDSVLLGSAISARRAATGGPVLDLGAGAGVAGLVALTHYEALAATFVEIDPATAALCRANIKRNGFGARAEVLELDVTAPGPVRVGAGLRQNHFATVLANPPYYARHTVTLPAGPGAARAHAHDGGDLVHWVKTACGAGTADAEVIFIYPATGLDRLLEAIGARLGKLVILPISPFAAAPAGRILVRGTKGSKAPLTLLPPLIMHKDNGEEFCDTVHGILTGTTRLDW